MSKTFIAVDQAGNRRLYLGNWISEWWEFSDAPLTYTFPESEQPR